MNTIDLDRPPSGHRLDVKISPDEAAGERQVRLFKDVTLFLMAAGFVILIIVFSYFFHKFTNYVTFLGIT